MREVPRPATDTPIRRPGGRSARVVADVRAAAAALVAQCGRASVTIPGVAARAGVNPTTIYRRWGDIETLLEDVAVDELVQAGAPVPDSGDLREDLGLWADALLERIGRPEKLDYLRHVVSLREGRQGRRQCAQDIHDQIAAILARAAQRGEPAPTETQVMDHIAAPLYYRVLMGLHDDDGASPRTLVDELLARAS